MIEIYISRFAPFYVYQVILSQEPCLMAGSVLGLKLHDTPSWTRTTMTLCHVVLFLKLRDMQSVVLVEKLVPSGLR